MHWIIQNNLFNEVGFQCLTESLDLSGSSYSIHKVVPFSHDIIPDPTWIDCPTIVMGSGSLTEIARDRGWAPGAFLDNLNYEVQLEHWGNEMLNHDAVITAFVDVEPFETPKFLRPVNDGKAFAGTVFDWYEFSDWQKRVLKIGGMTTIPPDMKVMACPLKNIISETRTWIVNGDVVTASGYKLGRRTTPSGYILPAKVGTFVAGEDVIAYAQGMADQWSPNRAYCMDIAETDDGFKIIEVNNLNSSGFYGANMMKLIEALESLCTS